MNKVRDARRPASTQAGEFHHGSIPRRASRLHSRPRICARPIALWRTGFTLIELLLATVLSSILILGVLMVVAGLSRDRRRLNIAQKQTADGTQLLIERLRWDLTNARTLAQSVDGRLLILVGHGGIDRRTLSPSGRLSRVIYRCEVENGIWVAAREQDYLDDPVRPDHWRELMGVGISGLSATPESSEPVPVDTDDADEISPQAIFARNPDRVGAAVRISSRVQVHLLIGKSAISEELRVR